MDKAKTAKILKLIKKGIPKHKQHGQYQMSLGSLIKALKKERTSLLVKVDAVGYPGLPHSYYGYPADLAFVPGAIPITVAEFLTVCESTVGASFVGPNNSSGYYKDYTMQGNTPVWISHLDSASKTAITDVVVVDDYIKLVTKIMEKDEEKL
jgi:hypothetical protein